MAVAPYWSLAKRERNDSAQLRSEHPGERMRRRKIDGAICRKIAVSFSLGFTPASVPSAGALPISAVFRPGQRAGHQGQECRSIRSRSRSAALARKAGPLDRIFYISVCSAADVIYR